MTGPRILHCIPSMSGGGAERQLAYLASALGKIGWTVHVALVRRGPNWERLQASGAVIHEITSMSAYDVRVFTQLRAIIDRVKPDLVQTWLLRMEVIGGLAALSRRTPWIFSERASEDAYERTPKMFARKTVARLATAIVSNSAAGDEYWQRRVGPRVRRYVIPNGIPLEEIDGAPAATAEAVGLKRDDPLILFAGRLEPQKNTETLLPAAKLLMARRAVQLVCCGEGSLRPQMDEWIAAEGLADRVKVIGYTPELWGLMKRAAMFVSPSLFEGSPNVVLEAMASGAPLVVSNIPEHRELLDDSAALMVDPRSVKGLADAMDAVLQDPASAARRAKAARDRATRYGLAAIAKQYDSVYREILSGASS